MVNVTLDLVNFNFKKNLLFLKNFLRKAPDDVKFYAITDFSANSSILRRLNIKNIYGTYGSMVDKTNIFISFKKCNYFKIAGYLVRKNIFSICWRESIKTPYFDLVVNDKKLFTWDYINEQYIIYQKKYGTQLAEEHSRLKIAFVTPLAKKSAIAQYSRLTLKELCKKADVDVYSLEKNPENTFGAENVFYLSPYPYLEKKYDALITVIGDSHFHDKMLEFHLLYGGYVICHDSNLLNYSYCLFGSKYLQNLYEFYYHSKIEESKVLSYLKDFKNLPFTATEPVIEASQLMFTHSKILADNSKSNKIKYLPFCVYADIDESKLSSDYKKQVKKELGYKEDDILITSFGGVAPHKMSDIIAEAFIRAKCADNVFLIFVGNAAEFQQFIKTVKQSDKIRYFTNFISKELYMNYLYASDFSIQLRNTTNGQVSGALADNIQAKLYTISCSDLSAAIDAPLYIDSLKSGWTIDDLTIKIQEVLKSKIYQRDFAEEKKAYLSEHNFKKYTDILIQYLSDQIR